MDEHTKNETKELTPAATIKLCKRPRIVLLYIKMQMFCFQHHVPVRFCFASTRYDPKLLDPIE